MKKFLAIAVMIILSANAVSLIVETASFTEFLYGTTDDCEYDNWISHVVEGIADEGYNLYSPWEVQADSFGTFVLPNELMLEQWQDVVDSFLQQDYTATQAWLNIHNFPYDIIEFHDTDSGNIYYMLREVLNLDYYDSNETLSTYDDEIGSFDYGWGLFVHNPQADEPIIITIPHPNDDFITPVIGYECFKDWNAKFLLIAGAGREVLWNEIGNYSNSRSLCDPSRNDNVAFNIAYRSFCDQIRAEFGRREFSAQIHSYDWNRHDGHPDCQISAMHNCPNLPIRDLSDQHLDIINSSDHIMVPQNTIGSNNEVLLNDYYSVKYSIYDFLFYNWQGEPYPVNDNIDLPGYSGNKQRSYSYDNWNGYDVFDPFFHLEMDELPGAYEETEENYHWFYGFDPDSNMFQMDALFDNGLSYYSKWIDAMTEILPQALEMDDNYPPPIPENLHTSFVDHTNINLQWDPVSSYDFHTFELIYAEEPITPTNFTLLNRDDVDIFASPLTNEFSFSDMGINNNYFFQLRTVEKNGDASDYTQELEIYTAPVRYDQINAIGLDTKVDLRWIAAEQDGNMGFNVYRSQQGEEFTLIDSWTNNFLLSGSETPYEEYSYIDDDLENGRVYTYMISSENEQGDEFSYEDNLICSPDDYFDIFITNSDLSIIDSVTFAKNQFAQDWQDDDYDIIKDMDLPNDYTFMAFYESNWAPGGIYLQQEVKSDFQPDLTFKTWDLRVKTNQINETLNISVCSEFLQNNENLFLQNLQTDQFIDLTNGNYSFVAEDSVYYNFKLYWGNLHPDVASVYTSSSILNRGGEEMTIFWQPQFTQLTEYYDLCLQNETTMIMINEQIDRLQTSYVWEIPEQTAIDSAQIMIRTYAVDGQVYEEYSNDHYAIFPVEYTLEYEEGWQLIANPWNNDQFFNVSDVFGENSELLIPAPHASFVNSDQFEFEKGYWLHADIEGSFTNSGSVVMDTYYYLPLHNGWNLITNPYLISCNPLSLIFNITGGNSTYYGAVQQNLIANAVYVYRDNKFIKTDLIRPHESFYVYVNNVNINDPQIRFTAYGNYYYNVPNTDWEVTFNAEQTDKAEIVIGCSEFANDDFDNKYDLPTPPYKPVENGIEMYIPRELPADSLFLYSKLYTDIRSPLSFEDAESKIWLFNLNVQTQEEITFVCDLSDLPQDYTANIELDGNSWMQLVSEVYIFSFFPSHMGELTGIVEISNNVTAAENNIVSPEKFVNYPNPFNPSTNIQFNIPNEGKVDLSIYNIKGQKVKTICDQILPAGAHEFIWLGKNSNDLPAASGIYFIRLHTDADTKIRKILLLK